MVEVLDYTDRALLWVSYMHNARTQILQIERKVPLEVLIINPRLTTNMLSRFTTVVCLTKMPFNL